MSSFQSGHGVESVPHSRKTLPAFLFIRQMSQIGLSKKKEKKENAFNVLINY